MSIDLTSGHKNILDDNLEKKPVEKAIQLGFKPGGVGSGVESKTIKTKTTSVPSNGAKKTITKKVVTKFTSSQVPVRKKKKKKLKRRQYQTVWGFLKFW